MRVTTFFLVIMVCAVRVQAADAAPTVLLLPFGLLGEGGGGEWIGKAVQQSLLSDLSRNKSLQPLAPAQAARAVDLEEARKAGKAAGADFVVYGSYQLSETGLRITGQVLDVNSGRFVGGVKATGTVRELFAMEDTIADQAKRILQQQLPPPPPPQANAQPNAPAADDVDLFRREQPWDNDQAWIDWARSQRFYDPGYYGSYYRYNYSYGAWPYYYGSWPYGYYYPRYRYLPRYGPMHFFPGGMIRERL